MSEYRQVGSKRHYPNGKRKGKSKVVKTEVIERRTPGLTFGNFTGDYSKGRVEDDLEPMRAATRLLG